MVACYLAHEPWQLPDTHRAHFCLPQFFHGLLEVKLCSAKRLTVSVNSHCIAEKLPAATNYEMSVSTVSMSIQIAASIICQPTRPLD